MDIQQVLPLGKPEDVKKMVKYAADNGKSGGGYIFGTSHNIQADTPMENVAASSRPITNMGLLNKGPLRRVSASR